MGIGMNTRIPMKSRLYRDVAGEAVFVWSIELSKVSPEKNGKGTTEKGQTGSVSGLLK